jgi:hypothetical protein
VAHMGETGNAYRILVKSRKGTRPLRDWRILFENTLAYHKVSRMYLFITIQHKHNNTISKLK